ncbi:MAG: extracellular solute-binding protein [Thiohalomonadaceae bacterium]
MVRRHTGARSLRAIATFVVFASSLLLAAPAVGAPAQALGYEPKYPPGFEHFDYVNPAARRGGEFILPAQGSFDSVNPFTLRGAAADGLSLLVFETLMEPSWDEPFSQYGLLAEDVQLADDGLSVTYRLRPEARFADGMPVTAHDVKFSFDTLKGKQAHPQYRFYWADIVSADALDERTVRFNFARRNPELHMIAGQIPVFARHWVKDRPFDRVALEDPIGSGPYRVERYQLGKFITYVRNPDYWANDLNVRRGMFNFERVTFKYYRDDTVELEGFKAGEFEFVYENNSKQWARDYVGPKFEDGRIVKREFRHRNNAGMQGFVFNLRRPLFADQRVRRAIALAMDFAWANRKLFYGQYTRCDSYFSNSELAATGLPSGRELELLERFRGQIPDAVFTEQWIPASTVPPHSLRENLKEAKALLEAAGWRYRDGALRNAQGQPFVFEITLVQKAFERIVAPFARNLARLGIEVNYRTVDAAIYQRKVETFDFDMVVHVYPQSQSPGNELLGMFHSAAADQEGSNNVSGIKNPVVDALVEEVIYAADREQLVAAVHALDRVLLHNEYLVPNWYIASHRVAYWDRFRQPDTLPLYYNPVTWAISTWWEQPVD